MINRLGWLIILLTYIILLIPEISQAASNSYLCNTQVSASTSSQPASIDQEQPSRMGVNNNQRTSYFGAAVILTPILIALVISLTLLRLLLNNKGRNQEINETPIQSEPISMVPKTTEQEGLESSSEQ